MTNEAIACHGASLAGALVGNRVRLSVRPELTGSVHLIDWSIQRASVRWDNGSMSGVALGEIMLVPPSATTRQPLPAYTGLAGAVCPVQC